MMKNTIYYKFKALFVLSFICFYANAQVKESKDSVSVGKEDEVLPFCSEMPEFVGGTGKMFEFLDYNTAYPEPAKVNNIEGKVMITFVVRKTGEITDVTQTSKALGYGLDEEAIRVVKSMPKWNPGKENGKPVNIKFTIPIRFSLKK